MAIVEQTCKSCKGSYTWRSQSLVLGKYPAGNILLSFAVLMSGSLDQQSSVALQAPGPQNIQCKDRFSSSKNVYVPLNTSVLGKISSCVD